MGKNSAIEWTDHTWNPWRGCHKVSAGCKNCYMFREQKRYGRDPSIVVRAADSTFYAPLRWKEPAFVFTCSWSDFFIEDTDDWRTDAWDIIRKTPHLTYLVLTKRLENIPGRVPYDWPLPNVWLGVSVENQKTADERIPQLLQIPAAVRFVSAEPLLGSIDLTQYLANNSLFKAEQYAGRFNFHGEKQENGSIIAVCDDGTKFYDGLDLHWLIVGGESGPHARPMHPDWVRSLRDQCIAAGVPFFFKGWGIFIHTSQMILGTHCSENEPRPEGDHFLKCTNKHAAGRLLDGREWNERP